MTNTTTTVTVGADGTVTIQTSSQRPSTPPRRPALRRCIPTTGRLVAEVIHLADRRVA